MSAASERSRPASMLLAAAAFVVIVAGLRAAAVIIIPVVFAWFLAVLCLPAVGALKRRRVPSALAVTLVLLAIFGVLNGLLVLVLGSLGELAESGPKYVAALRERLAYTLDWWRGKGVLVEGWLPERWIEPKRLVELIGGAVRGTAAFLSEGTLVLLTLVFMLLEAGEARQKLRLAFGDDPRLDRLSRVAGELQRYLGIKTVMSLALGLSVGLWAVWMGLEFPVVLGLVAFACHFIPNVGALLAALPAMALAFVQFDLAKALVVGLGYLVLGTVLGSLLEPMLMGKRLGLSALVVFLSLIFWGWLWGAVGMLLSVPLTLAVKILAEGDPATHWLATLLAPAPVSDDRRG